ncbi:mechanosensitive ion channel [Pikeienuella piscinae]|uniref:Mechanosensitive ion channel n=1 Tax=Pikeienuella piscinae TaxID=2748098 RepID=A0A7M3T5K8_9RHOB|nr:mechanosensitive ion channel [Pikeienuella piscinae]
MKSFIAAYQPAEADGDGDEDGEGLGKEGPRLGTALPVLRGFLLVLIFSITVMIALSSLGVNIGPMIAGAGIFGLAIGFGSQKFVADMISGFFYLHEDAFRVGEYVETDEGKGVVEQI